MKKYIISFIYTLIFLVFFDFVILRHVFQLGISFKDDLGTLCYRIPQAYVGFTFDALMEEKTSYDKVQFFKTGDDTLKIAFFGGSTGQHLDEELLNRKMEEYFNHKVELRNFSCSSSHHRQHLHMILEVLPKYNPDIIIFYGGNNETLQHINYDPRPGYPYNHYYKAETSPIKQFLIENSALVSLYELHYRNITNYTKLRNEYETLSEEWNRDIVNKYFETLTLANNISGTLNSNYYGKTKFIAFFQPLNKNLSIENSDILIDTVRKEIPKYDYIVDIYNSFDNFPQEIWEDDCHVKKDSGANEHIIDVMAKITAKKFSL